MCGGVTPELRRGRFCSTSQIPMKSLGLQIYLILGQSTANPPRADLCLYVLLSFNPFRVKSWRSSLLLSHAHLHAKWPLGHPSPRAQIQWRSLGRPTDGQAKRTMRPFSDSIGCVLKYRISSKTSETSQFDPEEENKPVYPLVGCN